MFIMFCRDLVYMKVVVLALDIKEWLRHVY
jgi:hypothetical protein